MTDGISGKQLFSKATGYTYGDFNIFPGYIDFSTDQVKLKTQLTKNISINMPIVSSPMDTVTESDMAINLALLGGIGIIHYNNTIDEQVQEILKTKRYNNGFINDPIVISPKYTVKDVKQLQKKYKFTGFPVTTDGKLGSKLEGLILRHDVMFIENNNILVSELMTTDPITGPKGCNLKEANDIIKTNKISKLPIVNEDGELVSLVCRKDLINWKQYPLASKNQKTKQLLVGAAVSTRDRERIDKLVEAGVDILVIDSSQGNSIFQKETIEYIKNKYPQIDIIGGNIITCQQAKNLIKWGVDGIRVGMSCGSICTTNKVCGVGGSQGSAVYRISNYCKEYGIPVLADGGISNTGDIIKALSIGASTVMTGRMLAGVDESPAEFCYRDGIKLKKYRGMGSLSALQKNSDARYLNDNIIKVAQGVTGFVDSVGPIKKYVPYLIQSIKQGFQDIGIQSIPELHKSLYTEKIRFEIKSISAKKEAGVHNLYSYTEAQF